MLVPQITLLSLAAVVAARNLPTVVWHGLGDSADSEGILSILDLISNHTGAPAYAISTGSRDSSFLGNVNVQLASVSETLRANHDLRAGFNAIGFSQGGQFLRAYVERYNDPPCLNLMTWGSQHAGIVDVPCSSGPLCQSSRFFVRNNAFSPWVQNRFVPAQYYRGHDRAAYLASSIFLADINNERPGSRNETYKRHLDTLRSFVMIMFRDDVTVIPKQSSLFQEVDAEGVVTPVEGTSYWRDLGLDALAARDALVSITVDGGHMQIDTDQLLAFMDKYFSTTITSDKGPALEHGIATRHDFL